MKTLKNLGMIMLVPGLFAAYEYTNISGFYNVGAFLIWAFTLLMLFLAGVMTYCLGRDDFVITKIEIPKKPERLILYTSRLVSILTTIYLIWTGHFITAVVDLLNLGLSFYFWMMFAKINKLKEASI